MTGGRFDGMNEQERRDLARRLAETSNVLDFESALRIVLFDRSEAERLIRTWEEDERSREEFARLREQRRLALLESR
jgi:hypothetical protein